MGFNRKNTDDWPCFVSVFFLVRSSHVHHSSRLSQPCQDFLQKFFFKSSERGNQSLETLSHKGDGYLENRSIQLGHPVQNQSIDFSGAFVVGTVACFGNGNKFDRSPIIDQILIDFTTCDRCPGVISAPKYQ
jgi:hypothetical protein